MFKNRCNDTLGVNVFLSVCNRIESGYFDRMLLQKMRKLLGVSVVTHQNDRLGLQDTLANHLLRSAIQNQSLSAFVRC